MKFTHVVFLVLSFVVVLAGCASPPIRSDFMVDKPSLKEGRYVDQVWFDENTVKTSRYGEVRLEVVRGVGISDQTGVTVAEAVQWTKEAITKPGTDLIVQSNSPGQTAFLELAITELNPGSTAARFWAGELGAGHAWVQIEGKLTDATTRKLIGYFTERERASGVATFRNSRGSDSGPGLVHDIIDDIANKVRKEIESSLRL